MNKYDDKTRPFNSLANEYWIYQQKRDKMIELVYQALSQYALPPSVAMNIADKLLQNYDIEPLKRVNNHGDCDCNECRKKSQFVTVNLQGAGKIQLQPGDNLDITIKTTIGRT